jgi:hypothetical protein
MTIQITTLPSGTAIIEVDGEVKTYANESLALAAIAVIENGAEHLRLAEAYASFKGLDGKNAKGKVNVVSDYLAWVDSGMPEATPDKDADKDATPAEAETDEATVNF